MTGTHPSLPAPARAQRANRSPFSATTDPLLTASKRNGLCGLLWSAQSDPMRPRGGCVGLQAVRHLPQPLSASLGPYGAVEDTTSLSHETIYSTGDHFAPRTGRQEIQAERRAMNAGLRRNTQTRAGQSRTSSSSTLKSPVWATSLERGPEGWCAGSRFHAGVKQGTPRRTAGDCGAATGRFLAEPRRESCLWS
jgi:hypothetical protein